ncbi:hypothetical protein E4U21_001250 [Claviceps maximensis]|nr:hypothetical protein E4U21_001250 [Claviceps maximensis]
MPANSLPAHQQLLSSLITSLSEPGECPSISQSTQQVDNAQPHHHEMTSRRRTLLLTLHVLFPSLVLPALELIDNQLVTRLQVPREDGHRESELVKNGGGGGDAQKCSLPSGPGRNDTLHVAFGSQGSLTAYAVQSPPSSKILPRQPHANAVSKVHIVHLAAWNCSCKDFNRSKFYPQRFDDKWSVRALDACSPGLDDISGALLLPCTSADEKNVPCCKHLLACLIVERLKASQATSAERGFSKSEIATLIAGL